MRVLVATTKQQGKRSNDFSFTNDGELVRYGFDCDGEDVDGVCGCKRSLIGFDSHKGTTTFCIAEMDINLEQVTKLIEKSLKASGFISPSDPEEENKEFIAEIVLETLSLWKSFDQFPIGLVLERRGVYFSPRIEKSGLCPICGEKIHLSGRTKDNRYIGSCQDAFTLEQWIA